MNYRSRVPPYENMACYLNVESFDRNTDLFFLSGYEYICTLIATLQELFIDFSLLRDN